MKFYRYCWWIIAMILLSQCRDAFEYSPNQVFDADSDQGINARNIAVLQSRPQDDTITIAFVGDSQRFYDELSDFIDTVNQIDAVDFVLLAGDISDFGLLEEFELITEMMSALEKPYIGVVGNHDVVARGEEVFERMFGPLDFTFTYGGVKFVGHNTNSKEYNNGKVPNISWLRQQLVKSNDAKYFITFSHVPPFSLDFDKNLEGPYTSLLQETPGLLVSLHGHIHEHQDGYPYNDGVRYITSHSFDQQRFVLIKIFKGEVTAQVLNY